MRDREQTVFEAVVEYGPLRWRPLTEKLDDLEPREVSESIDFLVAHGYIVADGAKLEPTSEYEDWP